MAELGSLLKDGIIHCLNGMDTIYILVSSSYQFWIGDIQHGSCVLGQLGLADKLRIVYTTKEAGQWL